MRWLPLLACTVGALGACGYSYGETASEGPAAPGPDAIRDPTTMAADARPGTDPGTAVDGGTADRVVFVSSATYTGALGGVSGADALCMDLANASSEPRVAQRTFRAWLSSDAESVARHDTRPARFVRVDGVPIAQSWSDLLDSQLLAPVDRDEKGIALSEVLVWTATNADGGQSGTNCDNWTSNSPGLEGEFGKTSATNGDWTDNADGLCSELRHLYCVET